MLTPRTITGLTLVAALPLAFGFSPTARPLLRTTSTTPKPTPTLAAANTALYDADDGVVGRRDFIRGFLTLASAAGAASFLSPLPASAAETPKVLVLGGTGFVGSRVVSRLKSLGVEVVATSRDGRDGTVALDVTSSGSNLSARLEELAQGATAVISCIGAIGTPDDEAVNSASGLSAIAAKNAGVKNFVYISVAPEVAEFAQNIDFLKPYMSGKEYSMEAIRSGFSTYYSHSYDC